MTISQSDNLTCPLGGKVEHLVRFAEPKLVPRLNTSLIQSLFISLFYDFCHLSDGTWYWVASERWERRAVPSQEVEVEEGEGATCGKH